MIEQERLLNKENNILQNQNISYADGEEQAKKHLEQFKQNLIENFNESELREEFVDECKDTDKQESIKLENVDGLFAHKRFKSTIMCNGLGEFEYIKIKDKKYSDNYLTYHISSDNDLDYLLNSLNEDIVDLKNKRKSLWCKIKEKIFGCD